jgi:hypothetical protein
MEERFESEGTEPRMGLPSLRVWGGPAPFFQSQRLKVGRSAARRVFVVTAILNSFQMCCLVKIAHYANEPRQESVARQAPAARANEASSSHNALALIESWPTPVDE